MRLTYLAELHGVSIGVATREAPFAEFVSTPFKLVIRVPHLARIEVEILVELGIGGCNNRDLKQHILYCKAFKSDRNTSNQMNFQF